MMKYSLEKEDFFVTPRLATLSRKLSGGKVLDAGCGTGEYFTYFNAKEIYGIDSTQRYLKRIKSKKLRKKIFLKKASVLHLPFKDETFDFILCAAVLEYMKTQKELEKAIDELKRVLKKDGILVISTPHKNGFTTFVRKKIIGKLLKQKAKDPFFVMGRSYTIQKLRKCNFTVKGCLGWVTWKNVHNEFISRVLDTIFWYFPVFSGSLIGIYEKK